MKLIEALKKKAILVNQINVLTSRVSEAFSKNITILEDGSERESAVYSDDDFKTFSEELFKKREELFRLKLAINKANQTAIENVGCIQELIMARGEMNSLLNFLRSLRNQMGDDTWRYSENKKKIFKREAKDLDNQIDDQVKAIEDLDIKLCALNAKIDVEI